MSLNRRAGRASASIDSKRPASRRERCPSSAASHAASRPRAARDTTQSHRHWARRRPRRVGAVAPYLSTLGDEGVPVVLTELIEAPDPGQLPKPDRLRSGALAATAAPRCLPARALVCWYRPRYSRLAAIQRAIAVHTVRPGRRVTATRPQPTCPRAASRRRMVSSATGTDPNTSDWRWVSAT
jgi:hypothetical protein